MTESSTLYALLHFGTGTWQLSMCFFPSALSAVWLSPVIQFQAFGKVCPPICCLVVLSSFTSDCVVSTLITSDYCSCAAQKLLTHFVFVLFACPL